MSMKPPVWVSWTDISFITVAFLSIQNSKSPWKEAVTKKKCALKFKNKTVLGLQENQNSIISFTAFHVDQLCFVLLVLNIPISIRKNVWKLLLNNKAYL